MTCIGYTDMPSRLPAQASTLYCNNITKVGCAGGGCSGICRCKQGRQRCVGQFACNTACAYLLLLLAVQTLTHLTCYVVACLWRGCADGSVNQPKLAPTFWPVLPCTALAHPVQFLLSMGPFTGHKGQLLIDHHDEAVRWVVPQPAAGLQMAH